MPTPSTGPVSMSDVNIELGRSASAPVNMNDPAVRRLAASVSGASVLSGPVGMASLRGAKRTEVFAGANGGFYVYNQMGFNYTGYSNDPDHTMGVPVGIWSPAPVIEFLDNRTLLRLVSNNTFSGYQLTMRVNGATSYTGPITVFPSAVVNDPWPNAVGISMEYRSDSGGYWIQPSSGGFDFSTLKSVRFQKG